MCLRELKQCDLPFELMTEALTIAQHHVSGHCFYPRALLSEEIPTPVTCTLTHVRRNSLSKGAHCKYTQSWFITEVWLSRAMQVQVRSHSDNINPEHLGLPVGWYMKWVFYSTYSKLQGRDWKQQLIPRFAVNRFNVCVCIVLLMGIFSCFFLACR